MDSTQLKKIILQVKSHVLVSSQYHSDKKYDFTLKGKKRNWNIRIDFSSGFPFRLPQAKLLDSGVIGTIPHVGFSGIICVEENDSVLLDYNRPVDIICCLLEEITRLLDRASLKIFIDELTDEYEGYFQSVATLVNSFYFANDVAEFVYLKIFFQKNGKIHKAVPVLLYDQHDGLPQYFSNIRDTGHNQFVKIIHLPLTQPVLPPKGHKPISPEYILDLVGLISDINRHRLEDLLAKSKSRKQFFVLISMPRTSGERSQLLLDFFTGKKAKHPFADRSTKWEIQPFLLARHNKSYLLERGGAQNSLSSKKVTIIGCGSVGSEVAMMIAKAGVGELTLVDHDTLEPDNIYRHRLGGLSLDYRPDPKSTVAKKKYKVGALAALLRKELPYVKVNTKQYQFCKNLDDKDFLNSDVVIIAVGSPTLSLQINRTLKELGLNKVIFCWNEAAGVGGHSVALDLTKCCYECLYSNAHGFNMNCELNLLETGQNISKNLTGCAGVFTPFSYLDSSQTAANASKHCIDMLLFDIHSNALSWKGDNYTKLKVTERYNSIALKESVGLERKDGCGVCNG